MFLGDNVIQGGISPLIADFANHPESNSQIVLTAVQRPEQYGVAQLTSDGRVAQLIEKPAQPPSNRTLVGIYMFDHHIFEATDEIQPSFRGELEITDAIQWLIDHGYTVYQYIHMGSWIVTDRLDDMLTVNSHVLDELRPIHLDHNDSGSQVDSRVTLERRAQVINSVVRGPAI